MSDNSKISDFVSLLVRICKKTFQNISGSKEGIVFIVAVDDIFAF